MDILKVFTMLGGIAMLLYGMDTMGKGLERLAGSRLQQVLEKLTANTYTGFFLGLIVTAVIQSSSATTVMVVGFVNSGIMTLRQACGVIMGANVGTTMTAWILSLTGLEGSSLLVTIFKPTTFSPLLAVLGIVLYMAGKRDKSRNIGTILLGFAVLMFGMDTVSGAMKPLKDMPAFVNLFTLFSNPILGVLMGAALTAIIQSSSASVGILQALSETGIVTYGSAIPIIMGQNIGTCVTAMLSSVGTNRNARRAAVVHLYFNIIGVTVFMVLFMLARAIFDLSIVEQSINSSGIAVVHTCFNLLATAMLLPFTRQLERLACLTVKDGTTEEEVVKLDERLLNTPAMAVEQSRHVTLDMAHTAYDAITQAMALIHNYDAHVPVEIRKAEDKLDRYEDQLGSYLVELSMREMNAEDSRESATLLHIIGDFERLGDHALNLVEAAEELYEKKLSFSESARNELNVLMAAVNEVLQMTFTAFETRDMLLARRVEPLEQIIDDLTKELKSRHIERLQNGNCTIQLGFVLADVTNNFERVADHCSNVAATLIEAASGSFDMHVYTGQVADEEEYRRLYKEYREKYVIN